MTQFLTETKHSTARCHVTTEPGGKKIIAAPNEFFFIGTSLRDLYSKFIRLRDAQQCPGGRVTNDRTVLGGKLRHTLNVIRYYENLPKYRSYLL